MAEENEPKRAEPQGWARFRRLFVRMGMGEGSGMHVIQIGPLTLRKYVGRFAQEGLQTRADNGLWHVVVEGQPCVPGEGATPALALRDAQTRLRSTLRETQTGLETVFRAESLLDVRGEPEQLPPNERAFDLPLRVTLSADSPAQPEQLQRYLERALQIIVDPDLTMPVGFLGVSLNLQDLTEKQA